MSEKTRVQIERKKKEIFNSLIFIGVIVTVIAGSWYLLQARENTQGTVAPDFSLTDIEENTFRLSDFRGKVVVLDFMATWCGPCRQQMPHYKIVWEKYGEKSF